jgi:phenylalanyl-tRNA synthetase alpha chain
MSASETLDQIDEILAAVRGGAADVASRAEFEALKGRLLGREKGLLPAVFASLKTAAPAARAELGRRANAAKREIEQTLERLGRSVEAAEASRRAREAAVDVTLPGRPAPEGALHPLTLVFREIEDVFVRLGYSVADGPELETDYYNFEALNFPPDHPARDTQDTLLVSREPGAESRQRQAEFLLRTHTSPVQIRAMRRYGAPLRIMIPGRVYRKDEVDATHSPVFHQVEGLLIDRGISLAHLKGTLEAFVQGLFGRATRARFSCSYFPFVEPGAQAAMTCFACHGSGCRTCKGSGWIEILGAGMVHPNVLRAGGIDPEIYSGFAFGMGVDRLAILKYGIPDIRLMFDNDLRFLGQFRGAL